MKKNARTTSSSKSVRRKKTTVKDLKPRAGIKGGKKVDKSSPDLW